MHSLTRYLILSITFAIVAISTAGHSAPADPMHIAPQCGFCHGADGLAKSGLPLQPANLACQKPDYLKSALRNFRTSRSHELMTPVARNLTDEQIEAAAAYYSQQCDFGPRKQERTPIAPPPLVLPVVGACSGCHGPTGISIMPIVPNLACQEERYIITALTDFAEGRRTNPMMAGILGLVKTPDGKPDTTKIIGIAQYFSSLCTSYDSK